MTVLDNMAPYGQTLNADFGMISPLFNLYTFPIVLVGICLAWTIYTRFFHPLAKFPGPFTASLSRLWYVDKVVRGGSFDKVARRLHAKHGPVVRIAPNEVSISDPEAMRIIYGIKSKFTKVLPVPLLLIL